MQEFLFSLDPEHGSKYCKNTIKELQVRKNSLSQKQKLPIVDQPISKQTTASGSTHDSKEGGKETALRV